MDTARNPQLVRYFHLSRLGSQLQRRIWYIFPAHGASNIKKSHTLAFPKTTIWRQMRPRPCCNPASCTEPLVLQEPYQFNENTVFIRW